uniref:Uncharacterized protein n=1 Tax=Trypanosoma vivax (strain Y486) TaxID=1055687 RepID=G0TY37_TRYVY|nr:hypothetical protein TVY486_0702190 [Trypanosoma vivax Y486]
MRYLVYCYYFHYFSSLPFILHLTAAVYLRVEVCMRFNDHFDSYQVFLLSICIYTNCGAGRRCRLYVVLVEGKSHYTPRARAMLVFHYTCCAWFRAWLLVALLGYTTLYQSRTALTYSMLFTWVL